MGIDNLHSVLQPHVQRKHISAYASKRLAIDGYAWLHRALQRESTAPSVALATRASGAERAAELTADAYVPPCMHTLQMLRHHRVHPLVVFDGAPLPMKADEHRRRALTRRQALDQAFLLHESGDVARARREFCKGVGVTAFMARQWQRALRMEGVPFVVAPYEADGQLAYLQRMGVVDGVMTEDSDLVAYGSAVTLFKFDWNSGQCDELVLERMLQSRDFVHFDQRWLRRMCILAGCDYLKSPTNLGIKTARALIVKHGGNVEAIFQAAAAHPSIDMPRDYPEQFRRTERVFRHYRVYCPKERRLVSFEPLPAGVDDADPAYRCAGPLIDPQVARDIAEGRVHPRTHEVFDGVDAEQQQQQQQGQEQEKKAENGKSGLVKSSSSQFSASVEQRLRRSMQHGWGFQASRAAPEASNRRLTDMWASAPAAVSVSSASFVSSSRSDGEPQTKRRRRSGGEQGDRGDDEEEADEGGEEDNHDDDDDDDDEAELRSARVIKKKVVRSGFFVQRSASASAAFSTSQQQRSDADRHRAAGVGRSASSPFVAPGARLTRSVEDGSSGGGGGKKGALNISRFAFQPVKKGTRVRRG